MTWLKLSDDYSDELARFCLSDAAFRTHTEALGWVMRRESGGQISDRDFLRFAESPTAGLAVDELCDLGLWERVSGGYVVRHHMEHQVEPAVLEARRVADAARQRRARHKKAGLPEPASASVEHADPVPVVPLPAGLGFPDQTRPDQGHADGHAVTQDPWISQQAVS